MARNQFGGDCYRCGRWVAPGTGHFERYSGGWRVQHAYGGWRGGVTCSDALGAARKLGTAPPKPVRRQAASEAGVAPDLEGEKT